jgi:hypothetical protein
VQLVVRDCLGVIDAPVQSHVETEGEEAHGGDSTKNAPSAQQPGSIDAMPQLDSASGATAASILEPRNGVHAHSVPQAGLEPAQRS